MGRRHSSKVDPWPIIDGHLATLADEDGQRHPRDFVEQFGVPLFAAVAAGLARVEISSPTGIAILTLAGLFAAFLFQLTIQLLDRAASWAESLPRPSPSTSRYADLLGQLSANAGYASLVSAATATAALAVAVTSDGWPERLLAALTVGLLIHLGVTLLLVARRVFLLTRARLNEARTAGDRGEA
jgi:Na+/proline symporter